MCEARNKKSLVPTCTKEKERIRERERKGGREKVSKNQTTYKTLTKHKDSKRENKDQRNHKTPENNKWAIVSSYISIINFKYKWVKLYNQKSS